jgi:hypothetical protein
MIRCRYFRRGRGISVCSITAAAAAASLSVSSAENWETKDETQVEFLSMYFVSRCWMFLDLSLSTTPPKIILQGKRF